MPSFTGLGAVFLRKSDANGLLTYPYRRKHTVLSFGKFMCQSLRFFNRWLSGSVTL